MSDYILVKVGTIHADSTVNAGASPVDVVLSGAPIKVPSSVVVPVIRDRREDAFVQRGSVSLTSVSTSPQDIVLGTAVDLLTAVESISFKEKRTNGNAGITAILNDSTHLRLKFDTIAGGDTIDVDWKVAEYKSRRSATVRILDSTHVRLEFDGTLQPGESIDVDFSVFDYSNAGNDIKEILFRLSRLLAYDGENSIVDKYAYDQAGNAITFRVRTFDSESDCENATPDIDGSSPLQTGENSRETVTIQINTGNNRRSNVTRVLTDLASTPGVD